MSFFGFFSRIFSYIPAAPIAAGVFLVFIFFNQAAFSQKQGNSPMAAVHGPVTTDVDSKNTPIMTPAPDNQPYRVELTVKQKSIPLRTKLGEHFLGYQFTLINHYPAPLKIVSAEFDYAYSGREAIKSLFDTKTYRTLNFLHRFPIAGPIVAPIRDHMTNNGRIMETEGNAFLGKPTVSVLKPEIPVSFKALVPKDRIFRMEMDLQDESIGLMYHVSYQEDRPLVLRAINNTPHPPAGHPLPQGERGK